MNRSGRKKKVEVSSWDEALDVIDGKRHTLDGIEGVIRVDRSRQFDTRVDHHPTAKGKKTAAYLKIKRQLGDDWSTDLSSSERLADIASKFCVFRR